MRHLISSVLLSGIALAQNPTPPKAEFVVLSAQSSVVRIADPSEPVAVNGRVMRMSELVAAVSASNGEVQRLRNQEKRNHESRSPTQQSPRTH